MSGEVDPRIARTEIVLRSRRVRRALAASAAQHGVAAILLASAGMEVLKASPSRVVGWLSVATGVALVVAAVREIRSLRRHGFEPDAFPLVDLFAAAMLGLEGVHLHERGKHLLPWVYGALALLMLAKVVAWPRLARLRRVRIDGDGLDVRVSPLRRVRARWEELTAVDSVSDGVRLVGTSGENRTIRLDRFDNRAEAEERILAAARVALRIDHAPSEGA